MYCTGKQLIIRNVVLLTAKIRRIPVFSFITFLSLERRFYHFAMEKTFTDDQVGDALSLLFVDINVSSSLQFS